jgi:hypothetical protein
MAGCVAARLADRRHAALLRRDRRSIRMHAEKALLVALLSDGPA